MLTTQILDQRLTDGVDILTTVNKKIYTVATGKQIEAKLKVSQDGSEASNLFKVYVVPGGGSPTEENRIFSNIIGAYAHFDIFIRAKGGDEIWVNATFSGATAIATTLDGFEIT